ncbi:hypothetical protein [Flavobacterium tegetincola]|uniref:hypothetical protein n=1 Tax=Flavobacterium tegetincola TaxID=150172 RepID=UPI00047CA992|nr:hypothetical protein [Flavobacterium tegetincola]
MKKYKLILLFYPLFLTMACKQQNDKSYWITKDVTKKDGRPFHGITSSYMDMIAEMRIHLTKNGDIVTIDYPYEKNMKLSEFKSLTNVRIKDSGELLDSITEVKVEGDLLKINFIYAGTSDDQKSFSVNLIQVNQDKYDAEITRLKKDKEQLLAKVKPVDLSNLDLAVSIPSYFKEENISNAINPVQLADELADMNKDAGPIIQITTDYSFESEIAGQPKENYSVFALENTEKIKLAVANVRKLEFNSIELISDSAAQKLAMILLTKNAKKEDLQSLYKAISANMPNATIITNGLPKYGSEKDKIDLDDFITISFISEQKTIKLSIDISTDDHKKFAEENAILAYDEQNPQAMKKVFEHYLNLFNQAKVRVYIVSKSFDEVIKTDDKIFNKRTSLADYRWK